MEIRYILVQLIMLDKLELLDDYVDRNVMELIK